MDSDAVSFETSSGVLKFVTAPDFESRCYNITVSNADDGVMNQTPKL